MLSCTSSFSGTGHNVHRSKPAACKSLRDPMLLFPSIQGYKEQRGPAAAPEIAGLPKAWGKPQATQSACGCLLPHYSQAQQNWKSSSYPKRFLSMCFHMECQKKKKKKTPTFAYLLWMGLLNRNSSYSKTCFKALHRVRFFGTDPWFIRRANCTALQWNLTKSGRQYPSQNEP